MRALHSRFKSRLERLLRKTKGKRDSSFLKEECDWFVADNNCLKEGVNGFDAYTLNLGAYIRNLRLERQNGVFATEMLAPKRLAGIGVGRSRSAFEQLAGSGISRFDLIDHQKVRPENIGQAGYTKADVGRYKVHVVGERITAINPDAAVRCFPCKAEEIPNLDNILRRCDALKLTIDNAATMFKLAALAQRLGVDTFVAGTTGNSLQNFVAFLRKNGPTLNNLLPAASKGVQEGYTPPAYFPSAWPFAEAVNFKVVEAILGVLHHRAGVDLPIADIGAALMQRPLIIGSNSVHGDLFNPARMFGPDDLRDA